MNKGMIAIMAFVLGTLASYFYLTNFSKQATTSNNITFSVLNLGKGSARVVLTAPSCSRGFENFNNVCETKVINEKISTEFKYPSDPKGAIVHYRYGSLKNYYFCEDEPGPINAFHFAIRFYPETGDNKCESFGIDYDR